MSIQEYNVDISLIQNKLCESIKRMYASGIHTPKMTHNKRTYHKYIENLKIIDIIKMKILLHFNNLSDICVDMSIHKAVDAYLEMGIDSVEYASFKDDAKKVISSIIDMGTDHTIKLHSSSNRQDARIMRYKLLPKTMKDMDVSLRMVNVPEEFTKNLLSSYKDDIISCCVNGRPDIVVEDLSDIMNKLYNMVDSYIHPCTNSIISAFENNKEFRYVDCCDTLDVNEMSDYIDGGVLARDLVNTLIQRNNIEFGVDMESCMILSEYNDLYLFRLHCKIMYDLISSGLIREIMNKVRVVDMHVIDTAFGIEGEEQRYLHIEAIDYILGVEYEARDQDIAGSDTYCPPDTLTRMNVIETYPIAVPKYISSYNNVIHDELILLVSDIIYTTLFKINRESLKIKLIGNIEGDIIFENDVDVVQNFVNVINDLLKMTDIGGQG